MEIYSFSQFQTDNVFTEENREANMHKAAQGFVGSFFSQMVEALFSEANESNEEGFATEMYSSFLSEAIAEKISASGTSKTMVRQIENMLRRQDGLEEIRENVSMGHRSYKLMGKVSSITQEQSHVRSTIA